MQNLLPEAGEVDMTKIRESTKAFITIATNHGNHMRQLRAKYLNSRGRVLSDMKVGEYVKIYCPPSNSQAVKRGRKVKHICHWRGPLRLTDKLSETTFKMCSYFDTKKVFKRHITNDIELQNTHCCGTTTHISMGDLLIRQRDGGSGKHTHSSPHNHNDSNSTNDMQGKTRTLASV